MTRSSHIPDDRILIIAEAGVNHDGDLDTALALVDTAAAAGADMVKFQTFCAARLVTSGAGKAAYQKRTTEADESQRDMLARLELSDSAHHLLLKRCAERGIAFLSSPFDEQDADFLAGLGLDLLKLPSGAVTDLPFLEHVGSLGRELILSTGMADLDEVRAAVAVLEKAGTPKERLVLLHCNTEYPSPAEHANLRAMRTLAHELGVRTGYSDHTEGHTVAVAAAALGAVVIEKHFTLDRDRSGPDHAASVDPAGLAELVRAVRAVEAAMGSGDKVPSPSEEKNIPIARKFLVAARAIAAGEPFSRDNLIARRTGTGGVSPMRLPELLGRPAPRDFKPDEPIEEPR